MCLHKRRGREKEKETERERRRRKRRRKRRRRKKEKKTVAVTVISTRRGRECDFECQLDGITNRTLNFSYSTSAGKNLGRVDIKPALFLN